MLSVGPDTHRVSPAQNIHLKNVFLAKSVMYITDNLLRRAHNRGWSRLSF